MSLKHKLFSVTLASMIVMGGFLASCEDECVDCDCNMVVSDVISPEDANETSLQVVNFDKAIIIRGENLSKANRVVVVDEAGNESPIELKPAFVTDRAIIVKLEGITAEKINAIRIYSKSCGANFVEYKIDGYPLPVVNGFYCEFVPDGGELQIAGNYFYGEVKVRFDVKEGDQIVQKEVTAKEGSTSKILKVTVPEGTSDGSMVTVITGAGSTTSKAKLRDRSQIFLDFDNIMPSGYSGALDPATGTYKAGVTGIELPTGCDGKFGALVDGHSWSWSTTNTLAFEHANCVPEWGEDKCLLDLSTTLGQIDYKYDANDYLLKFEVYVPADMPLKNWFDLAFYQYGSEDNSDGDFYNGGGFAPWEYMDGKSTASLPAARIVLGDFTVTFEGGDQLNSVPKGIMKGQSDATVGFSTSGWRTIAIPLTSEFFQFSPQAKSIETSITEGKSMGSLSAKDFFNMWISPESNGMPQDKYFVAFDNFRIVKDDGSGLIPGLYGTGTTDGSPSSKRDLFK
ncbi:MAG TPA: glycan-binding surface protein [Paludibacteraceae bacterium]|nr:glycan-binding surface protein [Paludibacteraceae bacterium]